MPRDSAGVMSLPPSTWATSGQTINVNQHNPAMREIEQALTDSLPRNGSAGMTGNFNANGFRITNVANPVNDGDAVSLGFARNATPVGIVMDYAGDFEPDGWMLCDGRSLSRSDEAALFAVIGVKFGSESATTFKIPDLRGRIVVGKDDMGGADAARMSFFGGLARTIGSVFGSASHVLTTGQMAKHSHGGLMSQVVIPTDGWGTTGGALGRADKGRMLVGSGSWEQGGETLESINSSSTSPRTINLSGGSNSSDSGADEAHTNTQPSMVMNKIIRVR